MPKPEVRSKWASLISEQSQSGETVEAFCRERGLTSSQFYTHFSLLKTIEAGFGLPCLNHACDAGAKVMTDLFGGGDE